METKEQKIRNRFLSYLKPEGDCLVFTGSRNQKGYGCFNNPWEKAAHRFAWSIENGPIPQGLMVLHNCDSPPCCEITHLRLGTAKDNTQDMIDRNRPRGPKNPLKGEKNRSSKITDNQAIEVASLIGKGLTTNQISNTLNISPHIINDIRSRKNRKYLVFTIPKKTEYKKNCLTCGIEFRLANFEYEKSKYCSYPCYWKSLKKKEELIKCFGCKKEMVLPFRSRKKKYCKIECLWESMKGKIPENINKNK